MNLPKPGVVRDLLVVRHSMAAHLSLRLPDESPDVEAFWAKRQVGSGPLPNLAASLQLLETTEAGSVYQFAFPSRVLSQEKVNNIVPGRYYVPAQAATLRAGRFLLLLHANGARRGDFEAWHARRLMQRGCHVAHIALPYQMERRPEQQGADEQPRRPSDLSHLLTELGQAVCDAADVLRWAREEGAGQVMVAGWSLGGLAAALVATQIPLDAALLVEPSANLAWSIAHRRWFSRYTRRALRQAGLSQAALEYWLAPVLPTNLRPQAPLAGLRILAARYDLVVGYKQVLALWRAWGQPTLDTQPTGHVNLLFSPALTHHLDQMTLECERDNLGQT